jgi:hypothetical protein
MADQNSIDTAKISGDTGTKAVKPSAEVLSRSSPRHWATNERGFLAYDNWDCQVGFVSDEDKWLMLTDPQILAGLQIRRGAMLFDGVQILPHIAYGHSRYKAAEKIADKLRWSLSNMAGGFYPSLMQAAECDWWKNTAGDLIWEEKTYEGQQILAVGAIDVHLPESYTIWRKGRKPLGLQVNGDNSLNGAANPIYPIEKFFFLRFRPNSHHWTGTDLASAVWTPFYMKNQGHPLNLAYMELFAIPSLVGTAPEDAQQDVPLLSSVRGANGEYLPLKDPETGAVVTVSPQQAMSIGLGQFKGSGSHTVLPPKAKLDMLQAQGDGRIFNNFEDARDWQIMVGILGTGNMTGRAKYGSNATAQTGESSVAKPVDMDAQAIQAAIMTSIVPTFMKFNVKESDRDLIPRIIVNGNNSFEEKLFVSIMANSLYADERLVDELAGRLGVPKPNFDKIAERLAQAKPVGTIGEE